jgi:hypothetical protein
MSRNGSGTYTLPAGNPVTTGTTISSTWANNTLTDIASSLTTSLAYDGQTAPVANLPMATYAHTGVGNATVRTMYASAGQVQDNTLTYLTSVSGTDTITVIAPVSMNAYAAGQTFRFIAAGANTTTGVTLNINSIGAKNITKNGTTALVANDILAGSVVIVTYDGTQFQLANPATLPASVSSFTAGTTGFTPSTSTTGAVTLAGTLNVANGGTGSTTLTSGSILTGNGTGAVSLVAAGSSGTSLVSNGSTWSAGSGLFTGTAVATTSGTTVALTTSVPSWVKRISLLFNGVSINGTAGMFVQIGAGSLKTSGYNSSGSRLTPSTVQTTGGASVGGFGIATLSSADFVSGVLTLTNYGSNIWISNHSMGAADADTFVGGGTVTLSGTLDRISITTQNGTDAFDAGAINIIYE